MFGGKKGYGNDGTAERLPGLGQALCCVVVPGWDQPMRMNVGFDCQMVRKSTTVPGLDASIMVLPPA
ncbi:hypothetical protein APR04_005853 [Promicromonospora umidemergens]|uniref:Uncharacterized protein n=1 Tax=Promicromonospora umidemergens TaxID=629679 RepID=A0ABP8WFU9_9MICO|nr:hypothetical protein [Promicromonospora umidemergens]